MVLWIWILLAAGGVSGADLDARQSLEQDLQSKLKQMLEPLLGAGHVYVTVFADLDATSGDTTYQNGRTVRHTTLPQGAIKRLSVSVVVDGSVRFEEKLKVTRELAAAAVGLDPGRGDQLLVQEFPFAAVATQPPRTWIMLALFTGIAATAAVALLLVLRRRAAPDPAPIQESPAEPASVVSPPLPQAEQDPTAAPLPDPPEPLSFDALQNADPQQLARFIQNEHPQTIALILSHLNATQAANLLYSLPPEMRADVAQRMAGLDQISPEIITRIAAVIGSKLKALGELSRQAYGGVSAVAEMFNRLDYGTSKEILESVEQVNPALVEDIRRRMFVFEDLLRLDASGVQEVLGKVDRRILTVALKGAGDRLSKHLLQPLSQRSAEMLREDMDALGPVKPREIEGAQQQILAMVRQMESEGVLSLWSTSLPAGTSGPNR